MRLEVKSQKKVEQSAEMSFWEVLAHNGGIRCLQGGNLVVDGILASSHSDWVLDDVVPPCMVPYLPAIYQAILRPIYWAQQLFCADWIKRTIVPVNNLGAAHGYK